MESGAVVAEVPVTAEEDTETKSDDLKRKSNGGAHENGSHVANGKGDEPVVKKLRVSDACDAQVEEKPDQSDDKDDAEDSNGSTESKDEETNDGDENDEDSTKDENEAEVNGSSDTADGPNADNLSTEFKESTEQSAPDSEPDVDSKE
ncbi:hypothetical protein PHET_04184 [Paragonimus heterotremus]|uniref:Uncharacterized protein n=1 Tax=Paragonimus heterotremus TaxID=100268 RepID=A0A8J4WIT4_9TREM|nr:hypothetical protein PHET_04184 [Paragonimus heterotremus]